MTLAYCDSCKTDEVKCEVFPGHINGDSPRNLCDICASTLVANFTDYRRNPDPRDVIVAMVQIAHLLRKEIHAAAGPAPEQGAMDAN